jgi:hypothetical protein
VPAASNAAVLSGSVRSKKDFMIRCLCDGSVIAVVVSAVMNGDIGLRMMFDL